MNKNSNTYTLGFAAILVTVVAALLAFLFMSTKAKYEANKKNEKMQNILATIGVTVDRDAAAVEFDKYIKKQLAVKTDGTVANGINVFDINLKKQVKKDANEQVLPLYIAEKDGKKFYIIPLYGAGLWDAIWGFISLKDDLNTVVGVNFDHKGETPGLGAQITEKWFQKQYEGKQLLKDANAGHTTNNFVSVVTVKGGTPASNTHGVDAISGSTKTSDGVTNMLQERLARYMPYFKTIKK